MGLYRLGISNPAANTDTTIFTATDPYLVSVIATNKSASASANLKVWVVPSGATQASQYAYIIHELPLEAANSYETFRFAVNADDQIHVVASTASISWQAYGLVQYDVKLGAGVVSWSTTAPANPVNGMIWVDSDATIYGTTAKPIYIYDALAATWKSTAASAIDTSQNYTFTGTIDLPTTTSIGAVSSQEIQYLDNATSNIQTQINSLNSSISSLNTSINSLNATIGSVEAIAMLGL